MHFMQHLTVLTLEGAPALQGTPVQTPYVMLLQRAAMDEGYLANQTPPEDATTVTRLIHVSIIKVLQLCTALRGRCCNYASNRAYVHAALHDGAIGI